MSLLQNGEFMENQNYEIVIKPKTGKFDVDFKEVWRYRDLVYLFVKRNFVSMYKQSILGPLWLILNPLMTSVVFTFVFGSFAGIPTDGIPEFLFYMAGNTIWGLFSSATTSISSFFLSNNALFSKIYFPRLVPPVSQAITSIVNFSIQFLMLLIFWVYYFIIGADISISINVLLLPVIILHAAILALSVGICISSLTTKYRDLNYAVGFGMQLWLYATPIVYPVSSTSGLMELVLYLNPMTAVVENFKVVLFGSGTLLTWQWGLSAIITVILGYFALLLFNRIEKTFVDTI